MDCCDNKKNEEKKKGKKTFWSGVAYGLIPHIGCIAFIIASILGVTILMQFFKPMLMNRYIFHYLILISIGFATLSSFLYLRKHKSLSTEGIKKNKRYLIIMYGSTIGINLILFILVFPFMANLTGAAINDPSGFSSMTISVDIPCPGHAPLISNELLKINGVGGSEYSFPNDFEVYYDAGLTSESEILSLDVFEEYPASVLGSNIIGNVVNEPSANAGSCSGGCGGTGSCGGGCGSPTCDYNK